MSEFILSITGGAFQIFKKGELPLSNRLIVGCRNPEQEIEWKPKQYYYNPLYNGQVTFIYREDQKLVSVTGHLASKESLRLPYSRTWFEVIPQPLALTMIPPTLRSMIQAIPHQVKAISQAVMQHLGIRVPADFSPTDSESWYQWLASAQLPIGFQFKEALRRATSAKVIISKETEQEFLTGKVPSSDIEVQIRMFQISEVTKRVRQIHDSNYVTVRLPKEVLDRGVEAVKNWLGENRPIARKFQLEEEPVSEQLLESRVTRSSPIEIIGYQRQTDRTWRNLWAGTYTPNDMIREILGEEEPI